MGCLTAKPMTIDDEYRLSEWQKWQRFNLFPWKLLFHVLLVVLSTYLVTVHNQVLGVTHRTMGQDFGRVFFPDDYAQYNGDAADNPQNRYFLFELDDFNSSVQLMMQRYWALPQISLTPTEVALPAGSGPDPVSLPLPLPTVFRTRLVANPRTLFDPAAHPSMDTTVDSYAMQSSADVYPFSAGLQNASDVKAYMAQTLTLTYDLRLRLHDPIPDDDPFHARACYEWQALFTYDFHARAHFEVLWQYRALRRCPGDDTINGWVAAAVVLTLLIAAAHELLTLVASARWVVIFVKAYARQDEDEAAAGGEYATLPAAADSGGGGSINPSTSSSPPPPPPPVGSGPGGRFLPRDVFRLARSWMVLTTVGIALVSVHAASVAAKGYDVTAGAGQEAVLGLGCAALWVSTMRYLDVSPRFYSTVLTLRASLPRIGKFLIGALPIFVAFGLFALVVLGRHAVRYADPTYAYMTLFAFINGDALRETYQHTEGRSSPSSAFVARAARYGVGISDYWWSGVSRGEWAYGYSFFTIVGDLHLVLITLAFMYVVINCCVALVEEAFFDTRSAAGEAQLAALKEKDTALRVRLARMAGGIVA